MNKQTITCKKCGYIYWIDNVSWSVIPPDMNCPNCLPAASVNTSYSGRAINERSEESAKKEDCGRHFLQDYCDCSAISDDQREESVAIRERTRIIKALKGLKKPGYCEEWKRIGGCNCGYSGSHDRDYDHNQALDQAIKAVGESAEKGGLK